MALLLVTPAILSVLLLSAHLFRGGATLLAVLLLPLPWLLLVCRGWVAWLFQIVLTLAALEWVVTAIFLVLDRQEEGRPWMRMVIILSAVAAFNFVAVGLFETATLRRVYRRTSEV